MSLLGFALATEKKTGVRWGMNAWRLLIRFAEPRRTHRRRTFYKDYRSIVGTPARYLPHGQEARIAEADDVDRLQAGSQADTAWYGRSRGRARGNSEGGRRVQATGNEALCGAATVMKPPVQRPRLPERVKK